MESNALKDLLFEYVTELLVKQGMTPASFVSQIQGLLDPFGSACTFGMSEEHLIAEVRGKRILVSWEVLEGSKTRVQGAQDFLEAIIDTL